MIDRVGLINTGKINPLQQQGERPQAAGEPGSGVSFKDVLLDNLKSVNQLQQDATTAIEDLQTGQRNDLETVLMATQKADTAFRMLQAVRNKVMDAYEEIKQIRV